jgi:hypothetical protein
VPLGSGFLIWGKDKEKCFVSKKIGEKVRTEACFENLAL